MAQVSEQALDRLFHALSDTTRRRLLAQLALGPTKVTDLARPFRMSLPAVSKHLKVLEAAGLAARSIDGRVHRLRLIGGPLEHVETWLDPYRSFWDRSLRDLRRDLELHPPRRAARDVRRGGEIAAGLAPRADLESSTDGSSSDDSTP